MKNIYCTLDTETFGGASNPKGIYHLAGIIHTRKGEILATFNYLISEHYNEIEKDSYAKRNFHKYADMIANGIVTSIPTEKMAVEMVNNLCEFYGVNVMTAYNSGFDFVKTECRELLNGRQFIDTWLMALQTITTKKSYEKFCVENGYLTKKRNLQTSAEVVYRFLTSNTDFIEEHTAFEDSKIEMQIFLECLKMHKKFTQNTHCFDMENSYKLFKKVA